MENNVTVLSKEGKKLPNTNIRKANYFIDNNNAYWVDDNVIMLKHNVFDKTYKRRIIKSENRKCYLCGRRIPISENATIDHVRSIADGGSNSRKNLRCCCKRCNSDKNRLSLDSYIKKIENNRNKYKYITDKQLLDLKFYALNIEPVRKGKNYDKN